MSGINGARILGTVAALILLATAFLHSSGYGEISQRAREAAMPAFWIGAIEASWVFFSVQLVVIAAAVLTAVFTLRAGSYAVLVFAASLLLANVMVLGLWVGMFGGLALIGLAAGASALAAFLIRSGRRHDG